MGGRKEGQVMSISRGRYVATFARPTKLDRRWSVEVKRRVWWDRFPSLMIVAIVIDAETNSHEYMEFDFPTFAEAKVWAIARLKELAP